MQSKQSQQHTKLYKITSLLTFNIFSKCNNTWVGQYFDKLCNFLLYKFANFKAPMYPTKEPFGFEWTKHGRNFPCIIWKFDPHGTNRSTQLVSPGVDKKNLACRSSHCQLPLLAHTRGWSPEYIPTSKHTYIKNLLCYRAHDIWEGSVTTRSEIWTKNIHSLGF